MVLLALLLQTENVLRSIAKVWSVLNQEGSLLSSFLKVLSPFL